MNKRGKNRHKLNMNVTATRDGDSQVCETLDISISGIRLLFQNDNIEAGEDFVLNFRLPQMDDEIEIFAIVRWVDSSNPRIAGLVFDEPIGVAAAYTIEHLPS